MSDGKEVKPEHGALLRAVHDLMRTAVSGEGASGDVLASLESVTRVADVSDDKLAGVVPALDVFLEALRSGKITPEQALTALRRRESHSVELRRYPTYPITVNPKMSFKTLIEWGGYAEVDESVRSFLSPETSVVLPGEVVVEAMPIEMLISTRRILDVTAGVYRQATLRELLVFGATHIDAQKQPGRIVALGSWYQHEADSGDYYTNFYLHIDNRRVLRCRQREFWEPGDRVLLVRRT